MKYVKSKSKTRSTTKRRVSKKKVSIVPRSVKSYVKSVVHRMAETKMASVTMNLTGFNSSIGTTDVTKILPIITQGTAQNNRIGSELKPLKLVIKGYFIYNTQSYLPAQLLGARMFIWQNKQVRSYGTSLLTTNMNLLELGGDGFPFTGYLLDYDSPQNRDEFYFYSDKKAKVMKPYGYTNSSTASTAMTDVNSSLYHSFSITLKPGSPGFPTSLKYDNASGSNQYPTNFAPYFSIGYCNLVNNSIDVVDTQIYASFVSTLYYEDS